MTVFPSTAWGLSIFSVFPLFWMLTAATNTTVDVSQGRLWFGAFSAENFKTLLEGMPFFQSKLWSAMRNSFFYAAVQTVLSLFICSLAGYGFELYHDKAKDALFGVLLMAMMIPGVATRGAQKQKNYSVQVDAVNFLMIENADFFIKTCDKMPMRHVRI